MLVLDKLSLNKRKKSAQFNKIDDWHLGKSRKLIDWSSATGVMIQTQFVWQTILSYKSATLYNVLRTHWGECHDDMENKNKQIFTQSLLSRCDESVVWTNLWRWSHLQTFTIPIELCACIHFWIIRIVHPSSCESLA